MGAQPEIAKIGRYTIIDRLGYGGTAEVFIAQREGDSNVCVIKRLHAKFERHPVIMKRLIREAYLATFLHHKNIASMLGAGFEDGRFVVAFEFVAGQTVEDVMRVANEKGVRVPLDCCLAIAHGALQALEHAHDLGDSSGKPLEIVHRDLSPRNMLVGYDGVVKIIDFGVARARSDDSLTQPGMLVGTLRYLSPEQALADPVDRRSDLYTLGVVMYELITGADVVKDGPPTDILRAVVNKVTPPITSSDKRLPRALDPVFEKALAKEREDRFPDARAFLEALATNPDLPKPASKELLGGLVKQLFPEGQTWTQHLAESAAKNVKARDASIFDHSIRALTELDIQLADLSEDETVGLEVDEEDLAAIREPLPEAPDIPPPAIPPPKLPPSPPRQGRPVHSRGKVAAVLGGAFAAALLTGAVVQRLTATAIDASPTVTTRETKPAPQAQAQPLSKAPPTIQGASDWGDGAWLEDMGLPRNLTDKMRALHDHPTDAKLFDELVAAVRDESTHLPSANRTKVEAYLNQANKSRSCDELEEAILLVGDLKQK